MTDNRVSTDRVIYIKGLTPDEVAARITAYDDWGGGDKVPHRFALSRAENEWVLAGVPQTLTPYYFHLVVLWVRGWDVYPEEPTGLVAARRVQGEPAGSYFLIPSPKETDSETLVGRCEDGTAIRVVPADNKTKISRKQTWVDQPLEEYLHTLGVPERFQPTANGFVVPAERELTVLIQPRP